MDPVVDPQNTSPGDGGGDPSVSDPQKLGWRTELPEPMRGHEAFAGYKTKAELYQGHVQLATEKKDLETKIATNYIPKLAENATVEQKAEYYKAIGRPDSPDAYDLPKTDGVEQNADLVKAAKTWFHEAGLSQQQAAFLSQKWDGFISAMMKAQVASQEAETAKAMGEIKKEWGANYEPNAAIAKRVAEKLVADNNGKAWLIAQDDPMLLRLLVAAAPAFLSDTAPPGSGLPGGEQKIGMNYTTMDRFKEQGG